MKCRIYLITIVCTLLIRSAVQATVIFSQNFSSHPNGDFSPYLDAANPGIGQWNYQSSGVRPTIGGGVLNCARTSSVGAIVRTTDFDPSANALVFRFDISAVTGSSVTSGSGAARLQVGSGFSANNSAEKSTVHSEFAINLANGNGFSFRDLAGGVPDSQTFGGRRSVMWVINNGITPFTYQPPNKPMQTVGVDKWDLWVTDVFGRYENVFNERSAINNGTQPLTDMKLWFNAGSGSILLDNFLLENEISVVPEPAATGILAVAFVGLVLLAGRWRRGRI